MSDNSQTRSAQWVYHQDGSAIIASKDPHELTKGWIFNEHTGQATNPSLDLTIHNISVARDDFSHAGVKLSDKKRIFHFKLGRPYKRELTLKERELEHRRDYACVFQIVDRNLTARERQLVQEWLQAKQDGWANFHQIAGRCWDNALMLLESVDGIDGY